MRFVVDDVKFLVGTICLQILHLGSLLGPRQPLFLIRGILALTKISFKILLYETL